MEDQLKRWMGLKEAARHIGMSTAFLRRCVRERRVPFTRAGGKVLKFERSALDQWLENSEFDREATPTPAIVLARFLNGRRQRCSGEALDGRNGTRVADVRP